MEMIAIVCIPVNAGIIYFSGDGTFYFNGTSSLEKFLVYLNEGQWTQRNILILVVLVEHALLII